MKLNASFMGMPSSYVRVLKFGGPWGKLGVWGGWQGDSGGPL